MWKMQLYRSTQPILFTAALALAGCAYDAAPNGPVEHESKSIELDNSELVSVDLTMAAGDLIVNGGSAKLMDADFTYNVPAWRPQVRYTNTGVRGRLTIEEGGHARGHAGKMQYRWNIRMNETVPLDFTVHFGAGEARLNLGEMSLHSVDVNMGVGQLNLDLRGNPKRDYDVRVRGGVGEANIYLPGGAGVYADVAGGIGGIKVQGLHQEGSHYVNDAYEHAKVRIRLDVKGGVGAINLYGE
jgi:hypothetical protein